MRRRDRQRAFFFVVIVGRETADVVDFLHDQARALDDLIAGRGDAAQALALARKQLQPEFFFEQLELLADTRLRRVQTLGSRRDVQPVIDNRKQILELL